MKRLVAAIVVALSIGLAVGGLQSRAEAPESRQPAIVAPDSPRIIERPNPLEEFKNVPIPTVKWVMAKAQCETRTDWRNLGTYGGAWGFMHRGYETDNSGLPSNSTWGRWGGFKFAKHPSQATPTEQVIIYLRINYGGWHRPNGMFRKPTSSKDVGNSCYQYANQVAGKNRIKVRNMDIWYRQFQLAVYLKAAQPPQR